MSPLRERMIEDMTLAGLAVGTQKIYAQAVYRLAAHYRRSPDQLSEEEVRAYLLRIPMHRGHLLRFDRGQATDLMAATIPI